MLELPGPGAEGVGLRGQGTDRAEVDDVAGHLGVEVLLEVRADLEIVTTTSRTELGGAGNVVGEPDASGAVDAAVHRRLDQRANVLVLNGTLAADLVEAAAVGTVAHGLVLKIALATLVANRAVEGVVGEEELHDALAGLVDEGRVGLDDHAGLDGPGAGRNGLRRPLDLDQAHTAVSGNHQLPVRRSLEIVSFSFVAVRVGGPGVAYSW